MQTPKASSKNISSDAPRKVSPRAVRELNTASSLKSTPAVPLNLASRTTKDKSPKVSERKSPRSPAASELRKNRPNKVSELESQISQLQEDLKKVNEQLISSESCKTKAQQDADESKEQLVAMSSKLEESQNQLLEFSASEEARRLELQKIYQDRDRARESELELTQQHSLDLAALASATNELQQLKIQLETVAESEAAQRNCAESADAEIHSLRRNLTEALSLVESMKNQQRGYKESEARAQARIKSLEGLLSNHQIEIPSANFKNELEITEKNNTREQKQLEAELASVKAELTQLRTALESAEMRNQEEQILSTLRITSADEFAEQIKSASSLREAELEAELYKIKADIEELKANLMDKETELQGISEENEGLRRNLEKNLSCHREFELEKELKKLKECIEDLKADLMDKETELQNISEENEILNSGIRKSEIKNEIVGEVEASKAAEQEAQLRLEYAMEDADKSKRKAVRLAEELEAAQAASSEMEVELRRLKVQTDQWRKAAEAAAAMLSAGDNGKLMERTGSLDSNYNLVTGKISPPYCEDIDDDLLKKKNGNMLKKIGVLWKKPQK